LLITCMKNIVLKKKDRVGVWLLDNSGGRPYHHHGGGAATVVQPFFILFLLFNYSSIL
jgi:hypothetical protein